MNTVKLVLTLFFVTIITELAHADTSKGIKVGVISGLTGMAAKWNQFQNMGIELAREDLAREGFTVTTIIEDSQTQASRAISAFNKLIDLDKVDAIVADDFGFAVAPLLPLTERRKKLLLAMSLPHDHYCAQAPNYFFSITSQFSLSVNAYEEFFKLHPEVKRISMFVFDDPEWGHTYQKIWRDLATKYGVEIVETFLTNEGIPDYKSALTKMLPKKPQAIFLAHEAETFLKALKQFNYKGKIVSANHILEMLAEAKGPRPELEGVYTVDPIVSEKFRASFVNRFSREPILEAYAGYEALMAIAKAFRIDSQAPHEAMRTLHYQGVAGLVDFTGKKCAGNFAKWGLYTFNPASKQILVPSQSMGQ